MDRHGRVWHPGAMLARAARILLALTAFTVVFVIATPGRAWAHADLIGTSPGNGQHLNGPPAQVRLRFSERVSLVTDAVTLFDADSNRVDTTPARNDGSADIVLDVPIGLGDGVYTVVWRAVSADSHPIHGAFVFSIGAATVDAVTDGGALAGADPALGVVFWVFRLLGYAALAVFAGGLLFLAVCWRAGWGSPLASTLVVMGWGTSLVCATASLVLQGPYGAGRGVTGVADLGLLGSTLSTDYGRWVVARLALLAVAGGLLALVLRPPGRLAGRSLAGARSALAAVGGVAVPATWPGTGHANAGGGLPLVVTTLHILAMVSWLGGLTLLFTCVLRGPTDASPAGTGRTLSRFSFLAMVCVGVLVVTGVYQAWEGLGELDALIGSPYGGLIAFKVALLGVLLSIAAASRSIVQHYYLPETATSADAAEPAVAEPPAVPAPRAVTTSRAVAASTPRRTTGAGGGVGTAIGSRTGAGAQKARGNRAGRSRSAAVAPPSANGGPPIGNAPGRTGRRVQRAERRRIAHLRGRLYRAVSIEAGIAVVILAITSVLVATPPGRPDVVPERLEVALQEQGTGPFSADVELPGGGTVHVVLDPPRVGTSQVSIDVRDAAGATLDVPEVAAAMSLTERGVGALPIALESDGPGQYSASDVNIPFTGTWRLQITVRTTDFDQTTVVTDVNVS